MVEKEQEILTLLERVFLRLGSAETDEQLENTLRKFLVPVILKLSDPSKVVQQKVMELLAHVNKRAKNRCVIQFPVSDLLKQLSESHSSPFVFNFLVIYVKMGFVRLLPNKQIELLPELIHCVRGKSLNQQNILLQLFMNSLLHFKLSSDDQEKQNHFLFNLPHDLLEIILNTMLNFLFLPYSISQGYGEVQSNSRFPAPPHGMSESSLRSLIGEIPLRSDDIEKIKLSIVQIIGSGKFRPQDVSCHLIVASSDPRHMVSDAAKVKIKQLIGINEWNNSEVVKKLYEVFLGTTAAEGNVKPTDKKMPCSIQLRSKIMNIFVKCSEASQHFPAAIQVVYESLFSTNTNAKLKLTAIQFVHQICLFSSQPHFDLMGPLLNSAMLKVVQNEDEDYKTKGQAYHAIGKIGKRNPEIVTKNFSLVQQLFQALSESREDITSSVQECLMMLAPGFRSLEPAKLLQLEAILMQNIENDNVASRIVSVRCATLVFPPKHLISRYALLLACGDVKEDVVNEALKSLNDETLDLPSFVDFIQFIHSKMNSKPSTGSIKGLPFKKASFIEMLKFAQRCLHKEVLSFNSLSQLSELKSPHIGKYVATLKSSNAIQLFVDLLKQFLSVHIDTSVLHSLLEIVAITKDFLNYEFFIHETWLKEAIFGTVEEASKYAAELFSLVVTQNKSLQDLQPIIRELVADLYIQNPEKQRGSLFCLGFLMNKVMMSMKQRTEKPEISIEDKALFEKAISFIANILKDSKQLSLLLAACCCFSELARCGWCALIPEGNDDKDDISSTKRSFIQLLIGKIQSSKENQKVRENAALCLSMMCVGEKDLVHKQLIIEGLMQTAEAKQYELHCVVGDALVIVGQGSKSSIGQDKWTSFGEDIKPASNELCSDMSLILDVILTRYLKSPNPNIRQAGCIWLLALVKKVGEWPLVQDQILKVQAAFISLLGENDDLTQDVVSRGLAVVYEKGNEEVKKELVAYLIDSLMSNRKRKLDVSEDTTNVFEEGSLGKTPEGQNISTYKELCSIANDLNQPDLIYKFMNLANHNASWNLKRGAAHGFSRIASQASEQLAPFLDKILPKLYRFQFDPNPRVRGAMQQIWSALVTDQDKMINRNMKEILVDLECNMTNPQWRVRESSCLALNDLVRNHHLNDTEDILPDLWKTSFRVCDDIKESVRKAANLGLQSLSKMTIKMCDASSGISSSSQKTISLVIPVLLDFGLSSTVDEVRSISLTTLMKMSKSSGELLKPHITTLVSALLESISTLEPQLLNYLSLHAASNQSTLDMIDKARLSTYKSSPMMEVVNQCIQLADDTAISSLLPKLSELLKNSVGLGTKICTSSVIISLIQKHPQDVALFSGKLLAILYAGLSNKNASLRNSFSVAIGYVVKVSKDSSIANLINKLQHCYFEKDDEVVRETCGTTIYSINVVCPDIIKRHSSSILPFVFFAMHESKSPEGASRTTYANSNWEEVWQEGTPCTEVGLKLYSSELVEIMQKSLESSSWTIRAQGARTMLTFIEKMATDLPSIHSKAIMTLLLLALPGRTWEGKEVLLKVLSVLCINCKQTNFFMETDIKLDDVIEVVIRECRKDNLKYKIKAIACLTTISETFETQNFPVLWELVAPIIKKKNSRKEGDDDIDINIIQEAFMISFDVVCRCWPLNQEVQKSFQDELCGIFVDNIGCNSWQIDVSLLRSMQRFIERWFIFSDKCYLDDHRSLISSFLSSLIPKSCQFMSNAKVSTLRIETISILELLFKKLEECRNINIVKYGPHKDELVAKLREISLSDTLLDLKSRAQSLLQSIF